jgi:hypothetical protein
MKQSGLLSLGPFSCESLADKNDKAQVGTGHPSKHVLRLLIALCFVGADGLVAEV